VVNSAEVKGERVPRIALRMLQYSVRYRGLLAYLRIQLYGGDGNSNNSVKSSSALITDETNLDIQCADVNNERFRLVWVDV
jgi:hypothetical protein